MKQFANTSYDPCSQSKPPSAGGINLVPELFTVIANSRSLPESHLEQSSPTSSKIPENTRTVHREYRQIYPNAPEHPRAPQIYKTVELHPFISSAAVQLPPVLLSNLLNLWPGAAVIRFSHDTTNHHVLQNRSRLPHHRCYLCQRIDHSGRPFPRS